MKKVIGLIFSFAASVAIGLFFPYITAFTDANSLSDLKLSETTVFSQSITGILSEPNEVAYIYESGKLLGAMSDPSKIDAMLEKVYLEKYQKDYPDSSVGLGEDVYITTELSLYEYEDIDDQIVEYIKDTQSYGIEVTNIEFSNKDGVYASIYVKDINDYYEAYNKFLGNFVSQETLNYVLNNVAIPKQTTYGSQEIGLRVIEEVTFGKAVALPEEIFQNAEDILAYLNYGENQEIKPEDIYTTVNGDYVDGVASKTGLTSEQVMILNPTKITSSKQLLEEGLELNVKYLDPMLTVEVTVSVIKKEPIYADEVELELDDSLYEGQTRTVRFEEVGSQNALYEEVYLNGQLASYELVSEQVTKVPVQEKILVGTKLVPGVGTGTFRWPVDNPVVTCNVGCYAGHRAVDIKNAYDRYGNVYAADRGTVWATGYHPVGGYYIYIDHNNGYRSYYGHLHRPAYVEVGTNVNKGATIGQIGMTGRATGPHVHFYIIDSRDGSLPHPCGFLGCEF